MSFSRAFATTMHIEGGLPLSIATRPTRVSTALSILPDMVRSFYQAEFWIPLQCDQIDIVSEAVAEELFEAAVNCGPGNGVKFLQRAFNTLNSREKCYPDLYVDGAMGAKTLAATLACASGIGRHASW